MNDLLFYVALILVVFLVVFHPFWLGAILNKRDDKLKKREALIKAEREARDRSMAAMQEIIDIGNRIIEKTNKAFGETSEDAEREAWAKISKAKTWHEANQAYWTAIRIRQDREMYS